MYNYSVMKMEKEELSPSLFGRAQVQNKEDKDAWIHKHWIKVRARGRIWFWLIVIFLLLTMF